jgi:L-lactate dehydrogenase complex protein LldE
MMREFWPQLFRGVREEAAARAVALRVTELSAFLLESRPNIAERMRSRVAYHDSCHMLRELGIREAPRQLLSDRGVEVVEIAGAEWCCGFGGTFSVKLPAISTAMADEKLDSVKAAGMDRIVGCDLSCLLHLQGRADRRGLAITTAHLAEELDGG